MHVLQYSQNFGLQFMCISVVHRFATLGPQMFLDYNSQKSWPAQLLVKASGSFVQEHLDMQGWEPLV